MKTLTIIGFLATALVGSGIALFRSATEEVPGKKKQPHIDAALELAAKASEMLEDARKHNEFDPDGRAMNAKAALDLANAELRMATASTAAPPAEEHHEMAAAT